MVFMKKEIIVLLAFILLIQVAAAKNVTVVYNFPEESCPDAVETISLSEDANAFTAFTQVAGMHSIDLNMAYFGEDLGWFVNAINGISNSAAQYWLFWVNYTVPAPVGISNYVPSNGETIELVYGEWPSNTALTASAKNDSNAAIANADVYLNSIFLGKTNSEGILQQSLMLMKDDYLVKVAYDGKEKTRAITVIDYSPTTISFVFEQSEEDVIDKAVDWLVGRQKENGEIGSHAIWGNAFALMALSLSEGNETAIGKGLDYLLENQGNDAGFGYPGYGSDALHTAVSTMAFLSNGKKLSDFDVNGATPINFLLTKQETDGGFGGWGASDIDTTSWAIMALEQAGSPLPLAGENTPINYMYGTQNPDGGFPYQTGQESKTDYTAEAIMALQAANENKNTKIQNALNYLKEQQQGNGCFGNSYLTALAAIAFLSYNEDANNIIQCLKTLQLSDGGFGRDGLNSNSVDTGIAIIALKEETLPLTKAREESNNLIPVNSIVKFVVSAKNSGRVSAFNVSIGLDGLPQEWIADQSSTYFFEIKPNETKSATIYATFKEMGNYSIYATVKSDQSPATNSNALLLTTEGTTLQASLRLE